MSNCNTHLVVKRAKGATTWDCQICTTKSVWPKPAATDIAGKRVVTTYVPNADGSTTCTVTLVTP